MFDEFIILIVSEIPLIPKSPIWLLARFTHLMPCFFRNIVEFAAPFRKGPILTVCFSEDDMGASKSINEKSCDEIKSFILGSNISSHSIGFCGGDSGIKSPPPKNFHFMTTYPYKFFCLFLINYE